VARAIDTRRHSLGAEVADGLVGAGLDPSSDVAVMEVSFGGFRVATAEPIAVNAICRPTVILDDGRRVSPRARVVYCRRQRPDGCDAGYVSGIEFVEDD
jgi:hypothetical protein